MKKYFLSLSCGIHEALTYRARVLIWFLQSTAWVVVLPFVWLSIYGDKDTMDGYSQAMMISYFFFIPVIDSLTISHVESQIQNDIKDGFIVNFTVRPLSYILYQFFVEIGYKCVGIFPPILAMLAIYPFIKKFLTVADFSWQLLFLIPILFLGNLIGFFVASFIGMIAFWTTRAEWAMHLWWMISGFVGGFIAPLEFFPEKIQNIISYTPFPLLIHTPISIILGNLSTGQILRQIFLGSVWVVVLGILTFWSYKRGIRKSEGIGI